MGEADVGSPIASPAAFDGEEEFGGFGEEEGLLFGVEHEVPEAFFDAGEGRDAGGFVLQLLPEVGEGPLAVMTERMRDFEKMEPLFASGAAAQRRP